MDFVVDIPQYNLSPISDTFLFPAFLSNTAHNVSVNLSSSLLQSVSRNSLKLFFSLSEYHSLDGQILASGHFTPMSITFGKQPSTILLSYHCLLYIERDVVM